MQRKNANPAAGDDGAQQESSLALKVPKITATPRTAQVDRELWRQVEETACASDRRFFKHHRGRRFRLRPAWDVEIAELVHQFGPMVPPRDGFCWWIVVQQLAPGVRVPFTAPHHMQVDPPERGARGVWRLCCPPEAADRLRKFEADLLRGKP
jgi:hypothetical protein